ncbi:MAG: FapA family protein [Planctomycetes bacterium]|nr:FapA family protein [Planctomycetota bacterium]NUQ35513.1 DUF342 domain-containing protein [Planctomycetaceae bacterium]
MSAVAQNNVESQPLPGEAPPPFDENVHKPLVRKPIGGTIVSVYTDEEKRHGWFSVEPSAPYFRIKEDDIKAVITECGLKLAPENAERPLNAWRNNRTAALAGRFDPRLFAPLELVHTKDAVEGQDGRVQWLIDNPDPKLLRLDEDKRGQVDYREMRKVINVPQHTALAVLHPPVPGSDGVDIYGTVITPKPVKEATLTAGNGVKYDDKDHTFYSEIDGHVLLKDGKLVVEPVYTVSGDVNLNVGNIDFRGTVDVKNDVLDGFVIRASAAVQIGGVLGDASIFAGADISVAGGFTGGGEKGKGKVETKQNFRAKYMLNASVHAMGDVVVESQIINCNVACAGRLSMPQGTLIGGHILALGGIECATIGADLGTHTILDITLDNFSTAETQTLDAEVKRKDAELQKLKRGISDYLEDPGKLKALNEKRRLPIIEKLKQFKMLMTELEALQVERKAVIDPLRKNLCEEIIVHKRIYAGTDIRINRCRQTYVKDLLGPIKIVPNYDRGSVTVNVYTGGAAEKKKS